MNAVTAPHAGPVAPAPALALVSPVNGEPLRPAGDHLLTDGERLWPHFDGCYYLRTGREALVEEVVSLVRGGRPRRALALLLCDRRDADVPALDPRDANDVLGTKLSFHRTVELLGYGGLGWYFEHRWIIPTYLSGLSLLHRHAPRRGRVLEIGAGLGHLTAHWERTAGAGSLCSDVVFSHLWLSRRHLRPGGAAVCFDANGAFPFPSGAVDAVLAHDCLHYLSELPEAIAEMRRVTSSGRLLVGHLHNAEAENFSPGRPRTLAEYRRLLDPHTLYDDAELTHAWVQQRPPVALSANADSPVQAFAFAAGEDVTDPLGVHPNPDRDPAPPRPGEITVNPLLGDAAPAWPSSKFVEEYVRPFPYLDGLRRPGPAQLARIHEGSADGDELRGALAAGALVRAPADWY